MRIPAWIKVKVVEHLRFKEQVPATEMAIIGFQGNPTTAAQYINMPADPLQRHNIIIGPKMDKRAVDSPRE